MISFVLYNDHGVIQAHGICPESSWEIMQPKAGWHKLAIEHEERKHLHEHHGRIAGVDVENRKLRYKYEVKLVPDRLEYKAGDTITVNIEGTNQPLSIMVNHALLPGQHTDSVQLETSIPRNIHIRLIDDKVYAPHLAIEIKP